MQVRPGEDPEQTDAERADGGRGEDGVWESNRWGWPGQWWTSVTRGLPAHDCASTRLPQVGKKLFSMRFCINKSPKEHLFTLSPFYLLFEEKTNREHFWFHPQHFPYKDIKSSSNFVNTENSLRFGRMWMSQLKTQFNTETSSTFCTNISLLQNTK